MKQNGTKWNFLSSDRLQLYRHYMLLYNFSFMIYNL